MRNISLVILFFLSYSCTSMSQERRDSVINTSDSISCPKDSITTSRITLLFAGDLMQHQAQINAARTSTGYDYSDCFKFVKEEIDRADIAIANLEVTLGGKPYRGYPAFSAPDDYLFAIRDAGFDVLITANNHCLDTIPFITGKEWLSHCPFKLYLWYKRYQSNLSQCGKLYR